nr:immunoglobulin light chain junction region [Macaca mulatta]MOX08435.1 immunoglobulin light chain junction region [Macaca mulatta]MOX09301.1 immunoglobulin light chain junction region [Macaca mulatta]MOX09538.1 immunoglobulin light chain junction region [Macaca mulatta]MOX10810.1 immunoglobulin light chain junction region [Macaca mulatta]
CMQAIELPLTF